MLVIISQTVLAKGTTQKTIKELRPEPGSQLTLDKVEAIIDSDGHISISAQGNKATNNEPDQVKASAGESAEGFVALVDHTGGRRPNRRRSATIQASTRSVLGSSE